MKQKDDWQLTEMLGYEHGRGDPFAAAVRATRMAMVITDPSQPDNPIVFVNEAFQELTGYSLDECLGHNCRFLQGPDTNMEVVDQVRQCVKNGTDIAVDLLNYRKDGTTFWNALYLSPVKGRDGNIQFYFASQLDVSERVEAQQQLINQKEIVDHQVSRRTADLEAALEAQTMLLHEVDHRVKNNLSVIGSLIRLQIREADEPATRAALRTTMERVDALAAVHRRLYQANDVRYFDVSSFALNLVQDAISTGRDRQIFLKTSVQRADLPSQQAASVGLLLNEILLYLLSSRVGVHSMHLSSQHEDDGITIVLASESTLAMQPLEASAISKTLIKRLSTPLNARVDWSVTRTGHSASIHIPRSE